MLFGFYWHVLPNARPHRGTSVTTMIYLEKSNLLFLKPFKTAGSSFEIALSKFAEPDDIVSRIQRDEKIRRSLQFPGPLNHKYKLIETLYMPLTKKLKLAYHKHLRIKYPQHTHAQMARNLLGPSRFDAALKVSIVRNPFEYLISHYFWSNRKTENEEMNFPQWLRGNPWVFTRNNQFYYIDDNEIIDYYIRFEQFEQDITHLERLKPELQGLYETFRNIAAKTNTRPPSARVTGLFAGQEDLVRTVEFFQREHIQRFEYSPPAR